MIGDAAAAVREKTEKVEYRKMDGSGKKEYHQVPASSRHPRHMPAARDMSHRAARRVTIVSLC